MGKNTADALRASCKKELARIAKQEEKYRSRERRRITVPMPDKVKKLLDASLSKALSLVFEHGGSVTVGGADGIMAGYEVHDYAVMKRGRRRDVKRLNNGSRRANGAFTALTAAEGTVLGIFGIGVPDAALFSMVLIRGVFRTAMRFGVDVEDAGERYLLLCMMEASLLDGDEFRKADGRIDDMLTSPPDADERELTAQSRRAASALSESMMVMKFIQGIPVAGVVGGVCDPVIYRRVTGYEQMKLYKRYLLRKLGSI